jgi:hypothetical protein
VAKTSKWIKKLYVFNSKAFFCPRYLLTYLNKRKVKIMAITIEFTEEEQIVGYVETHSGSLLIADGIVESEIRISSKSIVSLDLGMDKKRLPIVATRQGGRRYLLIPLEAAEPLENASGDTVTTENPAEIPKKKEETNDEG